MKYHIVPLGCQMNQSDSERIRSVLERVGYERTDVEEEADLLGVVACSVRQKAIDKVYSRIHKWSEWKKSRAVMTFASGCILPADREKLMDRFDLLFTINELPQLPDMLRDYGLVTPGSLRVAEIDAGGEDSQRDYWKIDPEYTSRFSAFVPIQNGCDKFCTFCAVPYTRGREVSRPSDEILAEVRRLVDSGFRSITLLGQNVNSYGLDRQSAGAAERGFADLLDAIGTIGAETDRRFWTYFTSPHPRDMTDDVIDTIARHRVLAKQLHLPIQSGDDKVLLRMNRNYKVSQYRRVVERIRSTIPEATLFTDIIVGFSGETMDQFEQTRAAMREFAFNMAYIAMYSPRPGAASARWDDDVPQDQKRWRLHELGQEMMATSHAYNRALVGRDVTVIVEGPDRKDGFLSAKTEGRLIVRFASDDQSLIGRFVTVRIDSVTALSMEGSFVQVEPDTLSGSTELSRRNHAAFRDALASMTGAAVGG